MNRKQYLFTTMMLFLVSSPLSIVQGQFLSDVESGFVTTGYNDIRIPGDQGTCFSLSEDLTARPSFFYRVRMEYSFASRHSLSLLYAPLKVESKGSCDRPILFAQQTFPAGVPIEAVYKFNSYRLTYRYDFVKNSTFDFGAGFTAKIRDAAIILSSTGISGEKKNVGFVPIINFKLVWHVRDNLAVLLHGDALAAKQGRAEDILLALDYAQTKRLKLRLGYRLLEGGADNDEVYSFSLFHYGLVGVSYSFLQSE